MEDMAGTLFSKVNPVGKIMRNYNPDAAATLYLGDRLELLKQIPSKSARLIVTSPPYNIGKQYEKRTSLEDYLRGQEETITACYEVLADDGSLCWQVGNHISLDGEVYQLDILIYHICKKLGLKLRNRIVWTFEQGLHCTRRFSGRHETILWFAKSDQHIFNLDPVRIPQKYPGKKSFKGPDKGKFTCNPLGKNPGDVWVIPNVKNNHIEKTIHPCQFPIELIERLVLSMTSRGDLVIDPYMGVGSALCAAVRHGRRGAGADINKDYLDVARQRVTLAVQCLLKTRPMGKPVYTPNGNCKLAKPPKEVELLRKEALLIS